MSVRAVVLVTALLAGTTAALAQPVYRCGAARNVYSQTPCRGGQEVQVSDPRSAEQRDAARAVTEATRAQASELELARMQTDAPDKPAQTLTAAPAPAARTPQPGPEPVSTRDRRRARLPFQHELGPLVPINTPAPKVRSRKTEPTCDTSGGARCVTARAR